MSSMKVRKGLLRKIEDQRKSHAILYVTGDRQGLEAKIGNDIIDLFVDHLDAIGPVPKISLILYTPGGNTSAAWNLVNLLHMFCDDLELIVPGKCMSAGTLISLGADRIVMTKQATLGPIDPSLQHPLNPLIPGASADARAPVSVEAVNGYLNTVCPDGTDEQLRAHVMMDLAKQVHPLVLGAIFRSRTQIRDLAEKLLRRRMEDDEKIRGIIDFLCSDSGSHDYTINRREALSLGLDVEKASAALYDVLRKLRESFTSEMELRIPFDVNVLAAAGGAGGTQPYSYVRAVIESAKHGAHHFVSEGTFSTTQLPNQTGPGGVPVPQVAIQDRRTFDGWRKH